MFVSGAFTLTVEQCQATRQARNGAQKKKLRLQMPPDYPVRNAKVCTVPCRHAHNMGTCSQALQLLHAHTDMSAYDSQSVTTTYQTNPKPDSLSNATLSTHLAGKYRSPSPAVLNCHMACVSPNLVPEELGSALIAL